jgi:predicted O-methyltransferase YrrM
MTRHDFRDRVALHLRRCDWAPHPQYSVFTQYDGGYYRRQRQEFLHKYRCLHAVARALRPRRIIELGAHAGSAADAFLAAAPEAGYLGLDLFSAGHLGESGEPWRPQEVARRLFEARGYAHARLLRADLRALDRLPESADVVFVDGDHSYDSALGDLELAATAAPEFVVVDDAQDDVHRAVEAFTFSRRSEIEWTARIDYIGYGVVLCRRMQSAAGDAA